MRYLQQITAYVDTRIATRRAARSSLNAALSALGREHGQAVGVAGRARAARTRRGSRALAAGAGRAPRRRSASRSRRRSSLKREVERLALRSPAAIAGCAHRRLLRRRRRRPPTVPQRSTPTSTSASRISSAGRATRSARGSRATCRSSPARRDVARRRLRTRRVPRAARGAPACAARGIDLNHEMVEQCRARGLDVDRSGRRRAICASLPDASLGGLFAAQVVEHLQPGLPAAVPRARVPQAAARRPARARDAEPGLLGRVLRELHPRHHARLAAASRKR